MASPRVFISSTCYDLADVRDSLVEFTGLYGFECVLSEKGDVFYHPDMHTHDSCLKEVSTCHLFILIIGGRFGGNYFADIEKSIVNAEFQAARKLNLPVFTFVKNDVNEDHRVYNKNIENAEKIIFPSIEKQEYAIKVFKFIDEVRKAPVNNGYFSFNNSNEIKEILRKQWSGMFYDFLLQRNQEKLFEKTQTALTSLTSINEKIEEFTKNILRTVNKADAEKVINIVEKENDARMFFNYIEDYFNVDNFETVLGHPIDVFNKSKKWYEFIEKLEGFEIVYNINYREVNRKDPRKISLIKYKEFTTLVFDGEMIEDEKQRNELIEKYYNSLKEVDEEVRAYIIESNVQDSLF